MFRTGFVARTNPKPTLAPVIETHCRPQWRGIAGATDGQVQALASLQSCGFRVQGLGFGAEVWRLVSGCFGLSVEGLGFGMHVRTSTTGMMNWNSRAEASNCIQPFSRQLVGGSVWGSSTRP